ncbi:hypothetical protein ACWDG9_33435 [Streptomyces sp. NPDC001073]
MINDDAAVAGGSEAADYGRPAARDLSRGLGIRRLTSSERLVAEGGLRITDSDDTDVNELAQRER